MMNFDWDAKTVAEVLAKHFDNLSVSDKAVIQTICVRALRKTLTVQSKKQK